MTCRITFKTTVFTWVYQVARARGIFLSEDPEHLSLSMTSRVGLSLTTQRARHELQLQRQPRGEIMSGINFQQIRWGFREQATMEDISEQLNCTVQKSHRSNFIRFQSNQFSVISV